MRTRYGVSPWIHEFPPSRRPDFPRFRRDRVAGVVIVGGGLTGCAVAYACAAAGLDTVLLERDRLGEGSSGRSAGLLTPEPGPAFRDVVAAHGLQAARRVFETWRRGSLEGAALLRRLNVKCGLEPHNAILVAGRDQEKQLWREYDARRAAGLVLAWLNPGQLAGAMKLDGAGGVRVRDGYTLDPYRACVGLALAAARRGAALFEHSGVGTVRFTRRHAYVIAEGGTIRTAAVVVATGSATLEFKSLRRHFKRRELYVAMTERVPAGVRAQLGDRATLLRDLRTPPHRVRWTEDDRLVVAGADRKETPARTKHAVLVQQTGELMYELLTMYPAILGLQQEYGWDVSYGDTADGLMYIGAHRNYPHHIFTLGGARDAVTGSFVAARIVVRALQGAPDKAAEVFGWNR